MRVLQSSSNGKGGRSKFHGSHNGSKKRSSLYNKRESNKIKEDERFSARFTDPRFKLSQRMHQRSQSSSSTPETELHRAAANDLRFASRLAKTTTTEVKNSLYSQLSKHDIQKSNGEANDKRSTNAAKLQNESHDGNFDKQKKENVTLNYDDECLNEESDVSIEEYEYVAEDDDTGYEHNGVFVGRSTIPTYSQFKRNMAKRAKELTGDANINRRSASDNNSESVSEWEEENKEKQEEYDNEDEDEDVCPWAPESVEWTEPRQRLAVVDCDWDHIRAVDLYAILFHALPMGGELKEVSVYLSEFGKKMLEHERMYGPDLWVKEGDNNNNVSMRNDNVELQAVMTTSESVQERDDSEQLDETKEEKPFKNNNESSTKGITGNAKSKKHANAITIVQENLKLLTEEEDKYRDIDEADIVDNNYQHINKRNNDNTTVNDNEDGSWEEQDNIAMLQECGEDGEYFSAGKYRKYEMDRMKYYYAIATFDSAATASAVYAELDGMDIEASGVVLNLQYVDDDETFGTPVSTADHIPAHFKPLSAFKAAALTQSRFRISWDQEDAFRHFSVQDAFTGTSAEDDLAAYLAPADSDSDNDEEGAQENCNPVNMTTLEQGGINSSSTSSSSSSSSSSVKTTAERTTEHGGQSKSHKRRPKAQGSLSKWEEKQRIRQRYAALLAEIGGLNDTDKVVEAHSKVNESNKDDAIDINRISSSDDVHTNESSEVANHESINHERNSNINVGKDSSHYEEEEEEDDDSLNRFSDVEFESQDDMAEGDYSRFADDEKNRNNGTSFDEHDDEYEDSNNDDNDDDDEMREMEATIDMEIDSKATQLQREIRRRQKLENANLATQAELRYKERRKKMKKTKKELMLEEREAEKAALLASRDEARGKLKALMNVEDNGAIRIAGKQRRKEHARKVKARAAEERDALRRRRVASILGVKDIVQAQEQSEKAKQALEQIDTRFQHKLLDDPRFQLEVVQKDKRISTDVVDLAGKVALARRAKR